MPTRAFATAATVNYRDEKLFAALAIAAERRLPEFNPQEVANAAWAFATVNYRDQKLCAALALAAERRLSEFHPQEVANTAWASATVNYRDEKLFAALAIAVERLIGEGVEAAAETKLLEERLFTALAREALRRRSEYNP